MHIKMIALDLDGTTLNSEGHISEYTRETLEEAAGSGVNVVVSTGRVYSAIPEEVLSIKGLRYVITSNGAVIRDVISGEIFYGNFLSESAVEGVIELAKEHGLMLEAFWDGKAFIDKGLYDEIKLHGLKLRNASYVLSTRTPVQDIYASMRENKSCIENINIFFEDMEELAIMRPLILGLKDATITSAFKSNIEVGGATTSKRNALEVMLSKLGITRDNLMCCGDAPNDIEMIKFAGLGVAMDNAWGDTKLFADYVTDSNDEDGVAKAIRKFVL